MSYTPEELQVADRYRTEGRTREEALGAIKSMRTTTQPTTTSTTSNSFSTDELQFASRWKEEGQSREAVMKAIEAKRANPGFQWSDVGAGFVSAFPTTYYGAQELEAKYNPVRNILKHIPGEVGDKFEDEQKIDIDNAQQESGRIQMETEAKGMDAELTQMVGNMAIDAGIYAIASTVASVASGLTGGAALVPSIATLTAMSAAKKAKYAKPLRRIIQYALKNKKTAVWAERMISNLPEIFITGVAQDTGQHSNVPVGLAMSTAATGLLSLVGLKGASKLILAGDDIVEDVVRGFVRKEEDVAAVMARLSRITEEDRMALSREAQYAATRGYETKALAPRKVPEQVIPTKGLPVDQHKAVVDLARSSGTGFRSTVKNLFGGGLFNKSSYLDEMGDGGVGIKKKLYGNTLDTNTYLNESAEPVTYLKQLRKATGLTTEEASDLIEGKLPMIGRNLSEDIEKFKKVHAAYFDDHYKKITATGIELNRRENYLSRILKSDVLENIMDNKVNKMNEYVEQTMRNVRKDGNTTIYKGEVSGRIEAMAKAYKTGDQRAFFEYYRKNEDIAKYFPDSMFERDYDKLIDVYTEASAKRRAFVKNFGANKELIMEDLQKINNDFINKTNKKANPKMAEEIMNQHFTRTHQEEYIKKIRAVQMAKMWSSAPTNIADNVQTAMRYGLKNVLKNMVKTALSPEARRIADLRGGMLEDTTRSKIDLEKTRGLVEKWLKLVGFEATQKWADRTVVLSALDYAEGLHKALKKSPNAPMLRLRAKKIIGEDMLEEFLRDGVSESTIHRIGAKSLQDMRPISPVDVPYWVDQPGAVSLVFQFKRFTFQQARSVRTEIFQAWKDGDKEHAMKAFGTLIFAGVMAGKAAGAGKDAMKDSLLAISNYIVNGKFESPRQEYEADTWIGGIFDDFGQAGGIGIVSELLESISRGTWVKGGMIGAFGGPFLSDVIAISEGITDPLLVEPERVAEGKTTWGKVANRSVSNLLNPLPFAKMVFDKVVKPTIEQGKAPEGRTPMDTIESAANSTEEAIKAGVFLYKKIKRAVGATDAAAISLMAGVYADPKAELVEIEGDGGEMMRKYIAEGKGEFGVVKRVIDGDTFELTDGTTVRFTTVDAPEISHKWYDFWNNEPGGQMSKEFLEEALPVGSKVMTAGDSVAGDEGKYGRKLRTVFDEDGRDIVKESYQKGHSKIFDEFPSSRTEEFKQSEVTGRATAEDENTSPEIPPVDTDGFKINVSSIPGGLTKLKQIGEQRASNKDKYKEIEAATDVPWQLIAAIHMREGGGSFDTYLHNGQKLGKPTTIVPVGKNFGADQWTEAAIDAINMTKAKATEISVNSNVGEMAKFAEYFNGLGYRNQGIASPYLWSGTTKYSKGKYTRDHYYDPDAVDKQYGIIPLLAAISGADKS